MQHHIFKHELPNRQLEEFPRLACLKHYPYFLTSLEGDTDLIAILWRVRSDPIDEPSLKKVTMLSIPTQISEQHALQEVRFNLGMVRVYPNHNLVVCLVTLVDWRHNIISRLVVYRLDSGQRIQSFDYDFASMRLCMNVPSTDQVVYCFRPRGILMRLHIFKLSHNGLELVQVLPIDPNEKLNEELGIESIAMLEDGSFITLSTFLEPPFSKCKKVKLTYRNARGVPLNTLKSATLPIQGVNELSPGLILTSKFLIFSIIEVAPAFQPDTLNLFPFRLNDTRPLWEMNFAVFSGPKAWMHHPPLSIFSVIVQDRQRYSDCRGGYATPCYVIYLLDETTGRTLKRMDLPKDFLFSGGQYNHKEIFPRCSPDGTLFVLTEPGDSVILSLKTLLESENAQHDRDTLLQTYSFPDLAKLGQGLSYSEPWSWVEKIIFGFNTAVLIPAQGCDIHVFEWTN